MKKVLLLGALVVLALGISPATADPGDPYCTISDVAMGEDGTVGATCTFTADANPHGYAAATPNDFRIFLDVDGDGTADPGDTEVIAVSPTGEDPLVGELTLETGKNYTVEVENGCAGDVCGHVGFVAAK